ncbi:MAG: hypothetical protein SH857_09695 [Chitinophagales bacterium]|nr:hypothetical protein [Chitinophagales bacterium]
MNTAKLPFRISVLLLVLLPAVYFFLLLFFNEYLLVRPLVQIWLTRSWVAILLFFLFLLWGIKTTSRLQSAKNFLFEPMSPLNLAMFRVIHFSLYFVLIVFLQMDVGKKMTMGYEYFPSENRVAIPWAEWYSLHIPITPEIIDALAPVFNISALMMFFGLFTRVSSIVYLITAYYLFSVHQMFGKVGCSHHLIWFPAILAFSNCGRMLSLDALIRKYIFKKPVDETPSVKYGFPIKASILLLGIIYFFPGFWKLWNGGFDWIFRCNLTYQMYYKWASLNYWMPFFRIDNYPALIVVGSLFAIAFELGFIFLAMKPAHRIWIALTGTLMHTGIYLFMKISFFSLLLNYAVLIDWEKIFARVRKNKIVAHETAETAAVPWKEIRGVLVITVILLCGNLVLGMAKLISYPFACYPPFDAMVPHETEHVYYEGYKTGELLLGSNQIKERIFKHRPAYNLGRVEEILIENHTGADSAAVQSGIRQIFVISEDYADFDSIVLYKIKHPLKPELKGEIKEKNRIGVFYPDK